LSVQGAAQLVAQQELTSEILATVLQKSERSALLSMAQKAKTMQKINATQAVVQACETLTGGTAAHTQGAPQ
jgi:UDP-N-acetylglucosamine--N-acetylmuramyl-(pentapeptide) pyrophosphoryl-undecaprenol N-acetylglucosamine transferase